MSFDLIVMATSVPPQLPRVWEKALEAGLHGTPWAMAARSGGQLGR